MNGSVQVSREQSVCSAITVVANELIKVSFYWLYQGRGGGGGQLTEGQRSSILTPSLPSPQKPLGSERSGLSVCLVEAA